MIGSRCGIANPDFSSAIRPCAPHCIAESVIQSSVGVLYSGGVSVEHPDARAIHLQRLPVLRLVRDPPDLSRSIWACWSRVALSLVVCHVHYFRIEYFRPSFESVMFLRSFPPSLLALFSPSLLAL
jgi:hypothetical protein